MTNVKFLRNEFEKEIKLDEKTIEKISLFGTPLESINEKEIEIEIFPNRPDLLSLQGYLRAFKAFIGKETGLKRYKVFPPEKNYTVTIDSSVKSIRPYTTCAIIKNLTLNDQKIRKIIELQEKLHNTLGRKRKKVAIGIYPLEKIKLPITYLALYPEKIKFIPLEYDKELTGTQILQKHSTGKEFAHLLKDYNKYPVFMDSDNKFLSMPPIINSNETGKVTEKTKEVFIECSGHDFDILNKTLSIIVTTFADIGGKIFAMNLFYGNKKEITPDLTPEKMPISLENINNLLGSDIKESDLSKLLQKMGYNYKNKKIEIPAWRTDILHEVDIIEDIAISYGYEKLIPELPQIATIGEESKINKIKSKISEILIGLGLIEISTYHLIKQDEIENNTKNIIELLNSKTEYKYLRSDLLIPALRIITKNKDHEYPQKIFEIGTVFSSDTTNKTETQILEQENLIIALSPSNFTEAKKTLDYLIRILNLEYKLEETTHKYLIEGRTANIILNNKLIGYFGEIHPKTLRNWNIKMPVSVIEISLEEIFDKLKGN